MVVGLIFNPFNYEFWKSSAIIQLWKVEDQKPFKSENEVLKAALPLKGSLIEFEGILNLN